jgi:hypothetical protein
MTKERLSHFILFFLFSFISFSSLVFAYGVQPSSINIFLSKDVNSVNIPLRVWNEGNEDITIIVSTENLSQFTTFSSREVLLKSHTDRLNNYTTVDITFNKNSGEKQVNGSIFITPKSSGSGIVSIISRAKVNVYVTQTDKKVDTPAYSFPSSSSGSSSSNPLINTSKINTTNTTSDSHVLPLFFRIILAIIVLSGISVAMYLILKNYW